MLLQVFLPSHPLQPGSVYFKVPFSVGIFGVMCDTVGRQVNYLLPESIDLSKGSNTVVNLLYDNFNQGFEKIRSLSLHADNCIGQNKNNLVVFFLNFLVLTGSFSSIELNFMVKGHTKFSCDRCFGLMKKKYRKCVCETLNELVEMIEQSTPISHTNTAVKVANETGDLLIDMYDWMTFFQNEQWKKVPRITSYSHIVLKHDDPGAVHCRETLNSEPVRIYLGTLSSPEAHPEPLQLSKFPHERQVYLYEKVREYCSPEAADILCPKPSPVKLKPSTAHPSVTAQPPKVCDILTRKRGRKPKKKMDVSSDEEAVDDPEVIAEIPPKKRGRPRKAALAATTEAGPSSSVNTAAPLKRGRGRPSTKKTVPAARNLSLTTLARALL